MLALSGCKPYTPCRRMHRSSRSPRLRRRRRRRRLRLSLVVGRLRWTA